MANITKVYLMNTLLEKDYAHTMYFGSLAAQHDYFMKRIQPAMTFTDFSYQRKDQVIRVPKHIDSLFAAKVNYCMYQNTEYSNKWFYAFITDMKYVDDGRTDVYIKTDCIQTWMFDITVKNSFVEREHAASDEIGEHTIDEALEIGEYVVSQRVSLTYGKDLAVIVGTTEDPDGSNVYGTMYAGIYSGIKYYVFDGKKPEDIDYFLQSFQNDEAVVCMFTAPLQLVAGALGKVEYGKPAPQWLQPYTLEINPLDNPEADGVSDVMFWDYAIQKFSMEDLNGHRVRNKKLLCFPYRNLMVSNNAGAAAVYKFELFYTEDENKEKTIIEPHFRVEGALTPGCSIRMIPCHYNGAIENHEEGINMGKFPVLNWNSDVYTNWLTQNSVNVGVSVVSGALQIIGGAAMAYGTGGLGAMVGGGSIAGGVTQIYGSLAQAHAMSFTPPQSKGNTNAADVISASGDNTFHFYSMSVKKEVAEIIDDFFDMFGYKCNRVKIPAKNHRTNYWYTKTIDANIVGGIPQDDLQTIKDCYNRGITFWKTEEWFRNYSVPNGIV